MLQEIISFFKESYAELQKVTWISKKEVVGSTIVIIVLIGILSVFVTLIDFAFMKLVSLVL